MKEYKLSGWPELPPPFHRTGYRRMLHEMSQRHVSVDHLMHASGMGRPAVKEFVEMLDARGVLDVHGPAESDSFFGSLWPLEWLRRTREHLEHH
ncbi:MAG TPA: hypothetical protein VFV25_06060 [Methylibium sp.]